MSTLQAFFAMGGYAIYVWPAYALFFIVLIADTVAPRSWDMLWPLLTMMLATKFYYTASLLRRVRTDLLALEGGKDWVRKIAEDEAKS